MNLGLLGKKIGMTQIFDQKGKIIPVTIVKIGPCKITEIKTIENCGYNSIQIGYIELFSNSKKLTKPIKGYFLKKNLPFFKHLKEYKENENKNFVLGQTLDLTLFKENEFVNVTGTSIGKGNAGNIKKNHFNRGAMTHGSKHHRLQGSLGAGTTPGRVFPGKKMAGRLGNTKKTIKNLQIVQIFLKDNLIVLKGSIPGKSGNLISIQKK